MRLSQRTVTFLCASFRQPIAADQLATVRAALRQRSATVFVDDGASLCAAFSTMMPALAAAAAIQQQLADGQRPASAIHSGPDQERNGAYQGDTFQRTLSILAAVHPGQIILSHIVHNAVLAQLPPEWSIRELGTYRLKDYLQAARLAQLVAPGLPAAFPPPHTLDMRPHNLPIQLTSLIGRAREVATLCTKLDDPATRLLTIVGASGTGKTRLALQVAVEQFERFPDGVYVVSLAPVTDPALVLSAIADELQIKEEGLKPPLELLAAALADKQMLLVLDNFEQILRAAPDINRLLAAAPRLKVLVTSQVACDVPGEQVFVLPPLALPADAAALPLDDLAHVPAVALFVARAQAVLMIFALTEANAASIVELCDRLKGLPLAIELVAAQSKRYYPRDMVVLLESHLVVGRAAARGNSREDILRPVLNWICETLGAPLSTFFARLGVFDGGCTVESAAAICNPDNELGLDDKTALMVLLENHLLLREELTAGSVRFTMLDAVHEYALLRLIKRRELDRFRQLHADYYLRLAETAAPQMMGAEKHAWIRRLAHTYHNVRGALAWSEASANRTQLMRLCASLGRFWFEQAHFREGRGWLESALAGHGGIAPELQARLLSGISLLSCGQAEFQPAIEYGEEALALWRSLGDAAQVIQLLNLLGNIASTQRRSADALAYYEEGLAAARAIDDRFRMGTLLSNIGVIAYYEMDFERAARYFIEGDGICVQIQDDLGRCFALNNLGLVRYQTGAIAEADRLLRESLAFARALDHAVMQADAMGNLAMARTAAGDLAEARALLEQATALREEHKDRYAIARTTEAWALLAVAEGRPARALRLIAIAHRLYLDATGTLSPLALRVREVIEAAALPALGPQDAGTAADSEPDLDLTAVFDALLERAPSA